MTSCASGWVGTYTSSPARRRTTASRWACGLFSLAGQTAGGRRQRSWATALACAALCLLYCIAGWPAATIGRTRPRHRQRARCSSPPRYTRLRLARALCSAMSLVENDDAGVTCTFHFIAIHKSALLLWRLLMTLALSCQRCSCSGARQHGGCDMLAARQAGGGFWLRRDAISGERWATPAVWRLAWRWRCGAA